MVEFTHGLLNCCKSSAVTSKRSSEAIETNLNFPGRGPQTSPPMLYLDFWLSMILVPYYKRQLKYQRKFLIHSEYLLLKSTALVYI